MVRVTHPPGGSSMMEASGANTSKTVRVLKPPGGGSSISFGEPEEVAPKVKSVPKASPFATEEAAESKPEAAAEQVQEQAAETAQPTETAQPSEAAPSAETAQPAEAEQATDSKANGTKDCRDSSSNHSNADFPSNSVDNNSVAQNGTTETQNCKNAEVVEDLSPVTPIKDHPASPVITNGNHMKSNGNSDHHESNGHSEQAGTPKTVEPSSPVPKEAEVPKSNGTSSPKSAQTNGTVKSPPASRQISDDSSRVPRAMPTNHHMRSSIMMQDEDSFGFTAPPRKKSESSPVKEKSAPQFQQAPPQRVRQPPGGFSTQLW